MPSYTRITPEGYAAFRFLCEFQYTFSIIDVKEYETRMRILAWLCDHGVEKDPRLVCDLLDDNQPTVKNDIPVRYRRQKKEPWILEFRTTNFRPNWFFIKADHDPNPSIPHGHPEDNRDKWPKLNPYTGDTVRNDKKILGRLKKKDLVSLWNNVKFTTFAIEQISCYMDQCHHKNPEPWKTRFEAAIQENKS